MTTVRTILLCDYALTLQNGSVQSDWVNRSELDDIFREARTRLLIPEAKVLAEGKLDSDLEAIALRMLDSADAALCLAVPGLFDFASVAERILERVRDGMRVWIVVPTAWQLAQTTRSDSRSARFKAFLEHFGIELTTAGVFDESGEFGHPRTFSLDRQQSPGGFRDTALFRGIERIVFQHAHAMKLHAEALAAAAIHPARFLVVDTKSDYVADWNEPDMSLIAVSYLGDAGGCVVATSGLPTYDAYQGPLGDFFVGASSNSKVITNLLAFLYSGQKPSGSDGLDQEVHRLIQSIERNLLELIASVLGDDWPAHISTNAREKAEARQSAEKSPIPWAAYLDLVDHINTIARNADAFRIPLEAMGLPTSRNKIEKEVFKTGDLIRLRILDSHATKRQITGHDYSADDLKLLRQIHQSTIGLLHQVRPVRAIG